MFAGNCFTATAAARSTEDNAATGEKTSSVAATILFAALEPGITAASKLKALARNTDFSKRSVARMGNSRLHSNWISAGKLIRIAQVVDIDNRRAPNPREQKDTDD
jgi:hypothetical protein